MSKVYGYCRLALADREAMTEQMALIDVYCRRNDLKLERWFCDHGVSGLSLDRNGLNGLLNVLQSGDIVIVKDIARLSRNASQCMALIEQIKSIGATLKIMK